MPINEAYFTPIKLSSDGLRKLKFQHVLKSDRFWHPSVRKLRETKRNIFKDYDFFTLHLLSGCVKPDS